MLIHQIKTLKQKHKTRVGRGGKRGTFSGRGTKGQKARAGRRIRPQLRDVIKKIPKRRGRGKHSFVSFAVPPAIVNIADLEQYFSAGEHVTPQTLAAKGLVRLAARRVPAIKLLGTGELTKKLLVADCQISASARSKIEKVGGSVAVFK